MVYMDLNETQLREEIKFWKRFIAEHRQLERESLLKMARESLSIAENQLKCALRARGILRSARQNRNNECRRL